MKNKPRVEKQLMQFKIVHILLVEDDHVDRQAIVRGFAKAKMANPVHVASDGIEALKLLRSEDDHEALPRPYLVLLDLSLPRMNGIEFLDEIRKDNVLKDSIVFVLTTSNTNEDKAAAYDKQVAGYIVKEKAGKDFAKLTCMLDNFWRAVEFPPPKE